MTYRAQGIIIGKLDIRDTDRLYTIYTKEFGKVAVVGQGVKKISSKLAGNLELLTHATFTVARGKTFDRVATIDSPRHHRRILADLDRLGVALYCLEMVDQMVKEGEPDLELFELVHDFLEALDARTDRKPVEIAHAFTRHFLAMMGYHDEEGRDPQAVLQMHLDRPLKSQAFFDYMRGAV